MKLDVDDRASPGGRRMGFAWIGGLLAVAGLSAMLASGMATPAAAQKPQSAGDKAASDGKGGDKAKSGKARRGRGGGRGRRGRRGGPTTVLVNPVTRGEAVETISVYGRLVARQTGVVASRIRGAVETVRVEIGDRVNKGDVLVTLVADMMSAERALKAAEVKEIEAGIRRAGAQFALAAQELERLERLRRSAAFSVARYQDKLRDVERSRSALAETRAKAEQARAELRMADINMKYTKIRAPFDGVVTRRHAEVGNYLNVGARVVNMVNDSALEVEAEIPSTRLGGLAIGAAVTVKPETRSPFTATVRAIVPEENPLARTRTVRFVPQFPPGEVKVAANESVRLEIPASAPRLVVTVSKDGVMQRRGDTVVFVVEDGKARMQPITLGQAFGARFEVLTGLKPGDQVVVRGNERLRGGQKVCIRAPGKRARPGGEVRRRGGRGGDAAGRGGSGRGKGERGGRRRGGDAARRGGERSGG
ncbi:MAG: efflux RND transporter periplasmic adaptor subunit [Alphaproteobacteria bacterium]